MGKTFFGDDGLHCLRDGGSDCDWTISDGVRLFPSLGIDIHGLVSRRMKIFRVNKTGDKLQ